MGNAFDKISTGLDDAVAFSRGDVTKARVHVRGYKVLLCRLASEDGGGFLAKVPSLPGCMSDGETISDAIQNVEDAIDAWVAMAKKHGDQFPEPMICPQCNGSGRKVSRILATGPAVLRGPFLETVPCNYPGCHGGYIHCCEGITGINEINGDQDKI